MAEQTEIEKLQDKFDFLEMKFDELSGKHGGKPKVKANPKFNYKDEHGIDYMKEVEIKSNMSNVKEGAKQLIPNKVILLPTKENPFHEQGVEFECDAALAETHIRRGFATHVRTKEENDKLNAKAKSAAKAE